MDIGRLFANLQTHIISGQACYACGPGWGNSGRGVHNDPFARLYVVRAGEGMVVYDQRMYHLRPGYLFLFPTHSEGRYRCPESMSLTWLHIDITLFGCLDPVKAFGWPSIVRSGVEDADRLEELLRVRAAGNPAAVLTADGLLRQVLARFAAAAQAPQESLAHLNRLEPVLVYMEHNLARHLSLAELAAVVHLQPTYFSNLFSRQMGLPPLRFMNRRRMERAAAMLLQGGARIAEVADLVGFCDVYHFSKTFKRFMGLSPSEYRQQLRQEA